MAIYNNAGGRDAQTLKKFREPAWNNPVVRCLDLNEKDLVPRLDRDWTAFGVLKCMAQALEKTGKKVPAYLQLAAAEAQAPRVAPGAPDPLANHPEYFYLPLTRLQAARVAQALAAKDDPAKFLAPSQAALLPIVQAALKANPQALKSLVPDRTPQGLPAYHAAVSRAVERR